MEESLQNVRISRQSMVIAAILIFGLFKGILFISLIPQWQAPDEIAYYSEIRVVADEHKIPGISAPKNINHPPLYYLVSYPFYVIGSPWGDLGRIFSLRFFGIIILVLTGYFGFLISREIFPESLFIQAMTVALIMLNPQLTFITGSINSDGLLNFFFALIFWLSVKIVKRGLNWRRLIALLIVIISGIWTKQRFFLAISSVEILVALLAVRYLWNVIKKRRTTPFLKSKRLLDLLIIPLIPLLLYDYLTRFIFVKQYGLINQVTDLASKETFHRYIFKQFWGYFGWLHIPMSNRLYQILDLIVFLSLIGLIIAFLRFFLNFKFSLRGLKNGYRFEVVTNEKIIDSNNVIIFTVFTSAIIVAFLATAFYQLFGAGAQGRYLFIISVPYYIIISYGLRNLIPDGKTREAFLVFFATLFIINLVALFNIIIPFYY